VVCGTKEGDLMLWRMKKNGRCFELIKQIQCHTRSIRCLEALANENIACNFEDNKIQIWNLDTGVMVHRLCDDRSVTRLVLLSNGLLASLLGDDSVTVWNVKKGWSVNKFCCIFTWQPFLALPNGLVAAFQYSSSQNISIFDSNTGKDVKSLLGHDDDVRNLVLLNDTHLASSSFDDTIKIWNLASGRVVQTFASLIDHWLVEMALLRDDVLACYSFTKNIPTNIQLWKWKTGKLWKTIEVDRNCLNFVKALVRSPDGQQRLICCSLDSPAKIVNVI
jgi:WD40 repeat protein